MFPLSTFLFPGEEIPLRIFEPRYKELINDCDDSGKSFGIPYIIDDEITAFGCEVELLSIVAKNSLNEMVILIRCIRNFRLLDFYDELPNKLYGGGIIEYLDDNYATNSPEIAVLIKKLKLDLDPKLGTITVKDSINLIDIAKSLFLKSEDKYKFYSLRDKIKMEKFLLKQLQFFEMVKMQEEILQKNFSLN
jgi:hypothetical protein